MESEITKSMVGRYPVFVGFPDCSQLFGLIVHYDMDTGTAVIDMDGACYQFCVESADEIYPLED